MRAPGGIVPAVGRARKIGGRPALRAQPFAAAGGACFSPYIRAPDAYVHAGGAQARPWHTCLAGRRLESDFPCVL